MEMERIRPIEHEGKEIIFFDYRGLEGDEELIAFIEEAEQYLIHLGRPTLQLTDITGVQFSPRVLEFLNKATHRVAHLILRDDVIGLTGVSQIVFKLYNFIIHGNARAFDDDVSAKNWLVE